MLDAGYQRLSIRAYNGKISERGSLVKESLLKHPEFHARHIKSHAILMRGMKTQRFGLLLPLV
jgi:hypothetical protein